MSLKSYRVLTADGSGQVMTIIVSDRLSHADWSRLIREGMNVIVMDERSQMVNKEFVDKKGG